MLRYYFSNVILFSAAWFGLHNYNIKEYYEWADGTAYDYSSSYRPSTTLSGIGGCFATTNTKTWSELACDIPKSSVCQYSIRKGNLKFCLSS